MGHDVVYEDVVAESIRIAYKKSKRKTLQKMYVDISGALTVQNIELAATSVSRVLPEYHHITIRLQDITDLDLTGLQMLYVMSSLYPGVTVDATHLDPNLRSLASLVGFASVLERSNKPSAD